MNLVHFICKIFKQLMKLKKDFFHLDCPMLLLIYPYVYTKIFFYNLNFCLQFRALMGCALCLFYLAIEQDPKVQLDETLDRCITTLSFIRLLMNLALKDDRWSWLVYNGTIYLYKMSRYLMTLGYALKVI
jgi:hypothetical protein